MKTRQITFRLSEEIYDRLEQSSERMGITKGSYITYALKQVFNSEDVMQNMPDVMENIRNISNKLDELKLQNERTEQ